MSNTFQDDGTLDVQTDTLGKNMKLTLDVAGKNVTTVYDGNNVERKIVQQLNLFTGFPETTHTALGDHTAKFRTDGAVLSTTPLGFGENGVYRDGLDRVTGSYFTAGARIATNTQIAPVTGDPATATDELGLQMAPQIDPQTGETNSVKDNFAVPGNINAPANQALQTVQLRDKNGNVLEYLDAENRHWVQTFDKDNFCTTLTRPDGVVTTWNRQAGGRLNSVTVGGDTTQFNSYNTLNQVTQTTDAANVVRQWSYDAFGKLKSSQIGALQTAYDYYPSTQLLKSVTYPGGRTVLYMRDGFGRVQFMVDPKGKSTEYQYDNFDRVTKIIYPDGKFETIDEYYASGLVKTHTDRAGRKEQFYYDGAGRLMQKDLYYADNPSQIEGSITYGYNNAGQVESQSGFGGSVTWQHDKRGQLFQVTHAGVSTTYAYNNAGQLKQKIYSGEELNFNYDPDNGRLSSIHGLTGTFNVVSYDGKGRTQDVSFPNGLSRHMEYDGADRLSRQVQAYPGQNGEEFTYDYTPENQLWHLNAPDYNVAHAYGAGRLVNETRTGSGAYSHTYGYDNNDNRTSQISDTEAGHAEKTFVYNDLNQLTEVHGSEESTFSYNDAGLMYSQTKNNVQTNYSYDRLNRLTGVNGPSAGNNSYSYYGPTWMRATATVNGAQTSFIHDGFACVGENSAAGQTTYFVPGSTPLWEHSNSETRVYTQDGRGNVTGLLKPNGTFAAKFNYDAFGNVKTLLPNGQGQFVASANTTGPRFQGQYYDASTDQVYLRGRFYSPGTGRFNATDPIGYSGGHNLYGYCMGDPVNCRDWMGTWPDWPVIEVPPVGPDPDDPEGIKGYIIWKDMEHLRQLDAQGERDRRNAHYWEEAKQQFWNDAGNVGSVVAEEAWNAATLGPRTAWQLNPVKQGLDAYDAAADWYNGKKTIGGIFTERLPGFRSNNEAVQLGADWDNLSWYQKFKGVRSLSSSIISDALVIASPISARLSPAPRPGVVPAATPKTNVPGLKISQAELDALKADAQNFEPKFKANEVFAMEKRIKVEIEVYRGGNSLEPKLNEYKVDPQTGLLKETHGVSLDLEASGVRKFGGAYKVKSIPDGLKIIQRGNRQAHYELVPSRPMTVAEYKALLAQVELELTP